MSNDMQGKVALVTGGASGIGRETALLFSEEGATVVVVDLNEAGAAKTAEDIQRAGGSASHVGMDVSDTSQVTALFEIISERHGPLDYAFNNAGIEGEVGVPFEAADEATWDRVIGINLKGVWLCMKEELAIMKAAGGGCIVNTASIAGLVGGTFGGAYFASKHGVVGLTKAAAVEYGAAQVRVNAVCPGVIKTEMADRLLDGQVEREVAVTALHPIGRLGTAREVAQMVVWLCSDKASFVTGQAIAVDGGYVAQ